MNFLTIFNDYIFYPVRWLIENLLNSPAIKNYLFGGSVTLFSVICTFIIGGMLIRFITHPIRLSIRDNSPVTDRVDLVDRQQARQAYRAESGSHYLW